MKSDYTHVSILLDASGSMYSIKGDIIGGFNNLIAEQKKVPGKLSMTVAQFNSPGNYNVINEAAEVSEVKDLADHSYMPSGVTALLDAISKIISDTGKFLSALSEAERPGKVLVTIITDGLENASVEETKASVAAIIKHQEETYKWQFAYIGANQDSFAEANKFGVHKNAVNYQATGQGVKKMFRAASSSVANYRGAEEDVFSLSQKDIDEAKDN